MVEKVIVKGGGTIDGAQFTNAATEATLLRLLDAMKGKKDGASGEEAKLRELLNRSLKENTTSTTTNTSARADETKSVNEVSKASKAASSAFNAFGNGISNLASGVLSLAVTAGSQFISFFTESMAAFRETSSVGASFNNDLVLLRRTAADAAMPLDEFSSMISKNSSLLASMGGTVTQGAMQFASMSKEMRTGDFGTKLMGMGMTMGDVNDYLGSYLDLQQRTGKLQGKSQQDLIVGAQTYALEMDKLTKATGMSRKEAEAAAKKASVDPIISALRKGLNPEELAKSSANLALATKVGGQEMEDAMKSLAAGRPDALGKAMMQAGFSMEDAEKAIKGGMNPEELMKRLRVMSKAAKDMGISGNAIYNAANPMFASLQKATDGVDYYNDANFQAAKEEQDRRNKITEALGSFEQMWQKFTGDLTIALIDSGLFKSLESGFQTLATQFLKYTPQITKAFTSLVGDLDQAFQTDDLTTGISNAFSVLFGKLTPIVSSLFRDLFEGLTGQGDKSKKRQELEAKKSRLEKGVEKAKAFGGVGPDKELEEVKSQLAEINKSPFDDLEKTLKTMFPIIGQIQGAVATVTDLFKNWGTTILAGGGIIFALGALNSLIGGAGKGLGKAIGGLGDGIGKLIGSIGKGLGTAIGGILTGVGEGLAFLGGVAGPMVIGAGALGLAIGLIGTGIAGATWIVGKALPTFAEGMAAFQNLNGDNLIKVGAGIGAIGVAMAAMGVGSAVSGIGNMLGGLADGITSLFGGKTPFDKLQEFSKYDIDTAKVENNATAIVAYSKAMAALGAGGAIGSLGGLVSSVADGLNKFFGGNPIPWTKIQEFQTIVLDGDKIEKNSNAVVSYAKAMAALAGGNAIGSLGGLASALADGLSKFFGGTIRLPWDRMIEFQNVQLNTDKIKQNSEALHAFGTAMSSVPEIKTETSGGIFGAIGSFFNGNVVLPWDKMIQFQNVALDGDKIKKNADVLTVFGTALKNIPEIKSETTGGAMGWIGSFFSGSQVMPWDKLKEFGEVKLDADKIKKNADILKLFGDSVQTFSTAGSSSITNVGTDFATQATGINTFTDSIKNLNKAITELNASLSTIASSGKGMLGGGKSNLEVVSTALGGSNTGGGAASEKLNTLVAELVSLTKEIKDSSKDQADALKGRRDAL